METAAKAADREHRQLALKIAAEKTTHFGHVEDILNHAKKLLAFLDGSDAK